MLCMVGVMHRMMQHVMGGWAAEVRRSARSSTASAELQRCARASRPVGAWRCGSASTLRASSSASRARWRRSRGARRAGRREKHAAAAKIQFNYRNHRAINAAKILIQKERENQAATKIQTHYHNHLAINAAKVMIRREKRRRAAELNRLAAA